MHSPVFAQRGGGLWGESRAAVAAWLGANEPLPILRAGLDANDLLWVS
jgi:hypothetical protein